MYKCIHEKFQGRGTRALPLQILPHTKFKQMRIIIKEMSKIDFNY